MKVILKVSSDSANSMINHDCEVTINKNSIFFVLENPHREFSVDRKQLEWTLSYEPVL